MAGNQEVMEMDDERDDVSKRGHRPTKVGELIEMVDGAIGSLKIAIISNQKRSFESPYTSLEFTERAVALQEDLNALEKLRKRLSYLDPDDDVGRYIEGKELERILRFIEEVESFSEHVY